MTTVKQAYLICRLKIRRNSIYDNHREILSWYNGDFGPQAQQFGRGLDPIESRDQKREVYRGRRIAESCFQLLEGRAVR